MNYVKIAAALHALADAFLADFEAVEETGTGKKSKKAAAVSATPPTAVTAPAPAAAPAAASAPVAASSEPAPAPVVPTVTKDQLNKAVLKVAAKSRDIAEALLAKFGAKNTVTLPPEQWQAVYDAFEEEIAKQDAAAVQIQQASLV